MNEESPDTSAKSPLFFLTLAVNSPSFFCSSNPLYSISTNAWTPLQLSKSTGRQHQDQGFASAAAAAAAAAEASAKDCAEQCAEAVLQKDSEDSSMEDGDIVVFRDPKKKRTVTFDLPRAQKNYPGETKTATFEYYEDDGAGDSDDNSDSREGCCPCTNPQVVYSQNMLVSKAFDLGRLMDELEFDLKSAGRRVARAKKQARKLEDFANVSNLMCEYFKQSRKKKLSRSDPMH